MKRIIMAMAVIAATALTASAQPGSIGVRLGATGVDATYRHNTFEDQFIEGNLGLDFGYNVNGRIGFKAAAVYNFVWARPAWTSKGSWALYAGPGLCIGGVNDQAVHKIGKERIGYVDGGFMFAAAAQVGVAYRFTFPLMISLDIRPYFGFHINDGSYRSTVTGETVRYGSKAGFYDNGMTGFIPSISVSYCF